MTFANIFRSLRPQWLATSCALLQVIASASVVAQPNPASSKDILIADFEGSTYGDWKVTGEAFGPGPAQGTLPNQMAVDGFKGRGLVNSFFKGDATTGTLTSPEFKIQRAFLRFLMGGGKDAEKTCMRLVIGGQVVRVATGPNDRPGGSERLETQSWEVSEFAGKTAVLEIVDQATGGWGHISVDEIVQTDRKPPGILANVKRAIAITQPYLNFPVKKGAPKRVVCVQVAGEAPRYFDIELADGEPDWWAFMDVAPFKGKTATVVIDQLPEDSAGFRAIDQSRQIKGAALYREKYRPQFHFTSRRGWNNDPNGLVYYQGEYHLFYQHNPYGWNWGNMHWGHAVSPDLVHWKELPEALYPDPLGTMFSGSAVVDWNNSAGFQTGSEKPLVCIFTAAGNCGFGYPKVPFTQGLAYSNDRGRTWTKYAGNPVLPHIAAENRDPKVIWYAPEKKWIMALFLDGNEFALYSSPDLKKWEPMSKVSIPGTGECPEFFEIPVDGNPQNTRWIFYGGTGAYLVGKFDGKTFTPESGPHALHHGNGWYASQTYTDIPAADGRRILVPWGQVSTPGMPFNQMMGFPVELTLRTTGQGPRLFANPVKELATLRQKNTVIKPQTLTPGDNPLAQIKAELFDLTAELEPAGAEIIGFNLRGVPVSYDPKKAELTVNGLKAPLAMVDGKVKLRFLVDRTTVEIFGNEGRLYMTAGVIVPVGNATLQVYTEGGSAKINALEVCELKSAWTSR